MNNEFERGILSAKMLFSPEVFVPMLIVAALVVLGQSFWRLNYGGDAMETFIKRGGDKLDFRAYEDFLRRRRRRGNAFIAAAAVALVLFYVCFVVAYI